MISNEYRRVLENSKPKRENFETQEEFEECYGWWMSHQGRILAMNQPRPASMDDEMPSAEAPTAAKAQTPKQAEDAWMPPPILPPDLSGNADDPMRPVIDSMEAHVQWLCDNPTWRPPAEWGTLKSAYKAKKNSE